MCSEVAIMKAGAIVERVPTAALRTGVLADPYSRQLLKSSEGYDRVAAAALVD
jgi:ABC-type dipeptide/oligopeptide/nickel transport system ATPase component